MPPLYARKQPFDHFNKREISCRNQRQTIQSSRVIRYRGYKNGARNGCRNGSCTKGVKPPINCQCLAWTAGSLRSVSCSQRSRPSDMEREFLEARASSYSPEKELCIPPPTSPQLSLEYLKANSSAHRCTRQPLRQRWQSMLTVTCVWQEWTLLSSGCGGRYTHPPPLPHPHPPPCPARLSET